MAEPEFDFSCLFNPSISFQEVENFIEQNKTLKGFLMKLSRLLKSESSNQISFQTNAHLGFLFSRLQEKDLADYFSNTVFSEILLANNNSLQSMQQVLDGWGNSDLNEFARNYSFCLNLRQTNQIPLVDNIGQVTYLGEPRIDDAVIKVQIAFHTGPIQASAVIKETIAKPIAKEIIMYMQKGYPRFYGVLSNVRIQNKLCRLTFFDQHSETFKQNMLAFNKLGKPVKDKMKNEREALALNFYRQLIIELNTYRSCELFHNNVRPSNILIYNNTETSGEYRLFLTNGNCVQFKLVDDATDGFPVDLNYEKSNKRYIAPEIVDIQGYCKKYVVDRQEFSYNVSDAWALAACILNFITDTTADRWNTLNFAQSLSKIVKDISNERLKDILLRSLEHNLRSRLKVNDALNFFN